MRVFQAVFVFVMTDLGATKFGDYWFPQWADALGWMMGASTLAPFVIFAVVHLLRKPKVSGDKLSGRVGIKAVSMSIKQHAGIAIKHQSNSRKR